MFKLGRDEEIDFEEDFLQDTFSVNKCDARNSSVPSCSKNNNNYVPTRSESREQHVLTARTDNVQSKASCSRNNFTSIKRDASCNKIAVSTLSGSCSPITHENEKSKNKSDADCENWLDDGSDDIDWDLCFGDGSERNGDLNAAVNKDPDIAVNRNLNTDVNPTINRDWITGVNRDVNTGTCINRDLNVGVNRDMNTGVNRNLNIVINRDLNTGVNRDLNTGVNRDLINTGVNRNVNASVNRDLRKDLNPSVNRDIKAGVNRDLNSGVNRAMDTVVNRTPKAGLNKDLNPTVNNACKNGQVFNINSLQKTADLHHNTSLDLSPNVSSPKHESLRSLSRTCRKRKFPGPAGLLPSQMTSPLPSHLSLVDLVSPSTSPKLEQQLNDDLMFSQLTQNPFESDPWLQMQRDLDLDSQNAEIITKYNISWVLLKAANKQLPCGKVPVLILVVKTVLEKGEEASVVFKDQTGEMSGTIHRKVFEEYEDCLVPGAVLVVRKVSVFSPTPRKHYLNVTPANVVCLYSPNCKRPRILAEGVTRPETQLREYAMESWITQTDNLPDISPVRGYAPARVHARPSTNRASPVLTSVAQPIRMNQLGPQTLQLPEPRVSVSKEAAEEDLVFPDDDMDLLFADLDNELC